MTARLGGCHSTRGQSGGAGSRLRPHGAPNLAEDDFTRAWRAALERLDAVVAGRLAAEHDAFDIDAPLDRFRGLTISAADVVRLLARSPGAAPQPDPQDNAAGIATHLRGEPRLEWLCRHFDLDDFEVASLVIALAPQLDPRYARLYGFLNDDVTQPFPTAALCLRLLCPDTAQRWALAERFARSARLLRHALLDDAAPVRLGLPELSRPLRVDPQIARFLMHRDTLDERLSTLAVPGLSTEAIAPTLASAATRAVLGTHIMHATRQALPLHVHLRALDDEQARSVARGIASGPALQTLEIDLRILAAGADGEALLGVVFREARLRDLRLHLRHADALCANAQVLLREALCRALDAAPGWVVVSSRCDWRHIETGVTDIVEVDCTGLDVPTRAAQWSACLSDAGWPLDSETIAALSDRFVLSPTQIARATRSAARALAAHAADPERQVRSSRQTLFAAARTQSAHRIGELATRIVPRHDWQELVLPADSVDQLREVCGHVSGRATVLGAWGFERKLSQGKGTSVLFSGPPGTGKTMAAEVIASELGVDLYKIDLACVVSKYIGETEKNLERIFDAADDANAVLLFDEADALFGKRSEVRDAHDRYANLEVSYLLQRIERYNGIAILATNLRQNLDEAFLRRLAFLVAFPFPDVAQRRRIWREIWPADLPLADDVDVDDLAQRFKLSGGHIKNIALAAAFLAATDRALSVSMAHLQRAARREFQKSGKSLSAEELGMRSDTAALPRRLNA